MESIAAEILVALELDRAPEAMAPLQALIEIETREIATPKEEPACARQILATLRFPRVALALLAGGAHALSGLLFQALLREALADPYTLGVSAGASLGAVIAISLGWRAIWLSSVVGAVTTLFLVLGVASSRRMISPTSGISSVWHAPHLPPSMGDFQSS